MTREKPAKVVEKIMQPGYDEKDAKEKLKIREEIEPSTTDENVIDISDVEDEDIVLNQVVKKKPEEVSKKTLSIYKVPDLADSNVFDEIFLVWVT